MKRKNCYLTILFTIILSLMMATGCGDLSSLAGSASISENDEAQTEEYQMGDQEDEESKLNCTVWLTKTGKCYHLDDCRYLKSKHESLTQKEAIDREFAPCSNCITSFWLPEYKKEN